MKTIKVLDEPLEPEYDSPNGSVWVVSIDMWGSVSVLVAPNIHPSFLQFTTTEEMGLPFESEDVPGVYKWTCSFWSTRDDMGFDVDKSEPLYSPLDTKEQ